jgi:dienelactone hydrolase
MNPRVGAVAAVVVLATAWSTGCAPTVSDAAPRLTAASSGRIRFASAGSLVWASEGTELVLAPPVVISGDLALPPGPGPHPAVILVHGCGGTGHADAIWAPVLRSWGYATFIVDSFHGRGLLQVCSNAETLSGIQRIPDAYGALRTLATHPTIDSRRVALMGFSHGGILTIGAATEWARSTFAPAGAPSFSAFVAFYPYCNLTYPELERLSAPLRIHAAELDDWTPPAPCADLVDTLAGAGQDASITLYREAHHGFDTSGRPSLRLPWVDSGADCTFRLPSILGPYPRPSEPMACVRKGATIGSNAAATALARQRVRAELDVLLQAAPGTSRLAACCRVHGCHPRLTGTPWAAYD